MSTVAASEAKQAQAKKKGKKEAQTNTVAGTTPSDASMEFANAANGENVDGVGGNQSPYVRDLQRNIRNVTKKLAATQKVDAIIAENPGASLEELVASRKMNADQKAQAQKKPALQAQLVQFEEQLVQYKKFEDDYQQRLAAEKEALHSSHQVEMDKLRETMKAENVAQVDKAARDRLLVLSRFLRAAAARRQMDDENSDESKAFEGVLLLLYGGDEAAVEAAEKLIAGSNEQVPSTEGISLSATYDRIKQMSLEFAPFAAEEAWVKDVASADDPQNTEAVTGKVKAMGTDPTIANAGLNELDDPSQNLQGLSLNDSAVGPEQATVDSGAANAAAADHWNNPAMQGRDTLADEWVSVPRNPTETENGAYAAMNSSTENWADEPNDPLPGPTSTSVGSDGFREVHHGRGKTRGSGSDQRGGRGRGGYRGGEGGNRGRGGYRGDRSGGDTSRARGRGGRGGKPRDGS